ncbi:hypothetical protein G6F16_008516 [Rhizopus arrhizus]|nr:hypothetical protein G6F20_008254 [Rhizopus arrhizus]KAG0828024.1 hypothetical protein G6F19_008459 [Rhizopus arrhizus]KAG0829411.1 hypothetical protein G6F18_008623 [Rhizopus arrhizus]KAG0852057.1 hypothetical protein G6F17_008450 [Rhizopus arrhizus]KAG0867792.1 hypothetical protein G6F16_008516 [Rhizopus arrhizus]
MILLEVYNEPTLLGLLRHSLSEEVKDALATRVVPSDLWPFVTCCVELECLMCDRVAQRKVFPRSGHSRFWGASPVFGRTPSLAKSIPEPMDIDAMFIRRFKPLSSKEKQRRRGLNLCMYCGDEGHSAPHCPKKLGKGQTQASISATAMIDSGAMSNFIDIKFAKANSLPLFQHINPAVVQTVDGSAISSGMVTLESKLKLTAANHSEIVSLDAVSLGHFPVILRIPWLNTHDPSIHWKPREILFSKFCLLKCLTSSPIVDALPINSLALKLNRSSHAGPVSSSTPHDIQTVSASNFHDLISSGEQVFSRNWSNSNPGNVDICATTTFGSTLSQTIPSKYISYMNVFSEEKANTLPKHNNADHRISLIEGAQSLFGPIYPLSQDELKALFVYVKENLSSGFISGSTSPSAVPILFVKKKYGSVRLYVDYRSLNTIIVKNRYPLPLINELMDHLSTAKVYTKLDIRNAYHLIRIAEVDVTEVEFLGFKISPKGVSMDQSKVSAITNWPTPILLKTDRTHDSSHKKKVPFVWSTEADQSFQQLKTAFTSAPMLHHFYLFSKIIIETDASDFAIAGVLSQYGSDNLLYRVAFYSRKLYTTETNYDIYDKELLAIIECSKTWRHYHQGTSHQITLYTNHKNLEYFATTKSLNRRQVQWPIFMASFDFFITYRPGTKNPKADALSRRSDMAFQRDVNLKQPIQHLFQPEQVVLSATFEVAPDSDICSKIYELSKLNSKMSELVDFVKNPSTIPSKLRKRLRHYTIDPESDLLLFDNLICMPSSDELKLELLASHHNSSLSGHFGQAKICEFLGRTYHWPSMRKFVNRYVQIAQSVSVRSLPDKNPMAT